jgi:hypothetical protein
MSEPSLANQTALPVSQPVSDRPDHRTRPWSKENRGGVETVAEARTGEDTAQPGHEFSRVEIHQRLPVQVQARPVIGQPGNRFEEEAERAADALVGSAAPAQVDPVPAASALLQRKPEPEDKGTIQPRTRAGGVPQATSALARQIESSNSESGALPATQRAFYEERFGHDFGAVRIHHGPESASMARSLSAQAFTHGRDIYFGAGYYQPHTPNGQRLIAHELAHTIQQTGAEGSVAPAILRQPTTPDILESNIPVIGEIVTPPNPLSPVDEDQPTATSGDQSETPEAERGQGPQAGQPGKPEGETRLHNEVNNAVKKGQTEETEGDTSAEEAEKALATESPSLAGLMTGDLALIDKELAEHQRWGEAAGKVGEAGSAERAKFITEVAAKGGGFTEGLLKGGGMGAGIKIGEKLIEKGAGKLALKAAARLGTQAAKFTPLPAVGAVIGGVMSVYDLASRDWKATGETIGHFGKGASIYDQLANSLESVSTVIEVANQVLNVIAGVIGAISIAMWVITVLTVGIASPLAATLSVIAAGIGLATLILDAINAMVFKQLITLFRSLHAFTSEADPRDVLVQGKAIEQAASAATGFVGGLAGGGLAEKGSKSLSSKKTSTRVPDHPTPGAALGDGPTVKAEPPVESASSVANQPATPAGPGEGLAPKAEPLVEGHTKPMSGEPPVETQPTGKSTTNEPETSPQPADTSASSKPESTGEPTSSKKAKPQDEASFEELNEVIKDLEQGSFGQRLQSEAQRAQQPPPTAPAGTRWGSSAYRLLRRRLRREQAQPPGTQAQHWTKWLASTRDTPVTQRMTPEMISQNRSWLQTDPNRPATQLLSDPQGGGTKYYIGDQPVPRPTGPQLELPGFEQTRPASQYTTEHRFADNYLIEQAKQRPTSSANQNLANLYAGAEARWRMEGTPGQGDWGWQPKSSAYSPQLSLFPETGPRPRSLSSPGQLDLFSPPASQATTKQPPPGQVQLELFSSPSTQPPKSLPVTSTSAAPLETAPVLPAQTSTQQPTTVSPTPTPAAPAGTQPAPAAETTTQQTQESSTAAPVQPVSPAPTAQPASTASSTGGPGPISYLPPSAAAGSRTGVLGEPVIEHVNPNYPAPPGTPQQIVDIQNEILETLDARAQAEAASAAMAKQESKHKANEKPLTQMQERTDQAIGATEAHKQAVARRTEANKAKEENEDKASSVLADYSNRAAKLSTITVPMRGFEKFTSLAYSLPDSPEVLVGAKRGLIKMNTDSKKFLNQLDTIDQTINTQKAGQGDRNQQTRNDANTLAQTDDKAKESDEGLNKAQQTTKDLGAENKTRLGQVTSLRIEADQNAVTLDNQEKQKRAEATSLKTALQTWAQNHKQARLDALEQTRKNLEAQGYKVAEVKEL